LDRYGYILQIDDLMWFRLFELEPSMINDGCDSVHMTVESMCLFLRKVNGWIWQLKIKFVLFVLRDLKVKAKIFEGKICESLRIIWWYIKRN